MHFMEVLVSEVNLNPVKSMRMQPDVTALEVDSDGLFGDRQYMVVEAAEHVHTTYKPGTVAEPGRFLSQREDPALTSFTPLPRRYGVELQWMQDRHSDTLFVPRVEDTRATRIPVSVWGWRGDAVDQGDHAAEFVSETVGRAVRFVELSRALPRYVEADPSLGKVGFADGIPLLVFSRASVAKVNEWLKEAGKPTVPADRFRGNIILDGIEAFEEDYIESIEVVHNGMKMVLERWKPCGRCPMPDTNQQTGERRHDLRSKNVLGRRKGTYTDARYSGEEIFFGQQFIIRLPEDMPEGAVIPIRTGDTLQAKRSDTTNWVRVAA